MKNARQRGSNAPSVAQSEAAPDRKAALARTAGALRALMVNVDARQAVDVVTAAHVGDAERYSCLTTGPPGAPRPPSARCPNLFMPISTLLRATRHQRTHAERITRGHQRAARGTVPVT